MEITVERLRKRIAHPTPWIAALLSRFLTSLLNQRQRHPHRDRPTLIPTKAKSVECSVLKAITLLRYAEREQGASSVRDLTQDVLNLYLGTHRNSRFGISAIIRYVNREEKLFHKLKLPSKIGPPVPAHLILPEARRLQLVATLSGITHPKETRWALMGLLNLVYAQPAHVACRLRLDQLRESPEGFQVLLGKKWLELDPIVVPLVSLWLTQRRELSAFDESGASPFLFPGMKSGTHIEPNGGRAFLRRQGLSGRAGRVTALATLIRNGLNQPRLLSDCFGISATRADQYCKQLSARDHHAAKVLFHSHGQP